MARDDVPRPLAAALGGARLEKGRNGPAVVKAAARPVAPATVAPSSPARTGARDRKAANHPSVQGRPALPKPAAPRPALTQAMRPEEHPLPAKPKTRVFTVAPNPLGSEVW